MFRLIAAAIIATIAASAFAAPAHASSRGGPRFTHAQILDAAYGAASKVYAGAYSEALVDESLYHVNSISARLPGYNGAWVELCSNDAAEARGWAARTNEFGGQRMFQGERETDKFFEFRYGDVGWSILMRVYKCSFARPQADLRAEPPQHWGQYNASMARKGAREFAEYEWFISNYNLIGHTLMASERTPHAGYDGWALYYTSVDAGGLGLCDEVSLHRLTTDVARGSRAVAMADEVVDTVKGHCH